MLPFLVRRLAASAVLLLLLLSLTFLLLHLAPGEPGQVLLDPRVPTEQAERLARVYRLDRPLAEQYAAWIGAFVRGRWGVSFVHQRPVAELLAAAVPPTLLLAGAALAVEHLLGLALGILAARRAGGRGDRWLRLLCVALYSLPVFWLGLMALLLFSLRWPLFPPGGLASLDAASLGLGARLLDRLHHLALPALVLGVTAAGGTARFVRSGLVESLAEEHVVAARAKGASESRVLWVHALRPSLGPLLHVAGLSLPFLLSGSLVAEVVFSWPGMGRLAYEAIRTQDYPVVLAATALTGAMVVVGNLAADLAHAAADPRVREEIG